MYFSTKATFRSNPKTELDTELHSSYFVERGMPEAVNQDMKSKCEIKVPIKMPIEMQD